MNSKNNRPDGWKNPHSRHHNSSILPTECKCWYCTEWRAYEAGADAMLEGLADLVGDDGYITFEKEDGKVVAVYIGD